jgi:hypothetical protein
MNLLQRIIDLGADADVISAVAMLLAESAAVEKRRASDRERQQSKRLRDAASRDVTLCHGTKESPPPNELYLTPPAKKITPLAPQFDFVGVWNEMAGPAGLTTCQAMSRQRKAALRSRLAEVGEDGLRRGIAAVGVSPFCRGENDRGWKAGPDFVLQESSLTKLLEGQYSKLRAANAPADDRQAFLQRKYG